MLAWGSGHYERTAAELEPAAEHVVALARLSAGERVVDLACGTGNAALLAARTGAEAVGLDQAARLIDVARARAAAAGLEVEFLLGDVQELPFAERSFDAALSVFGMIFAADPAKAFAEMMRVLRPGGRALVAVWLPAGPIDAMVGILGRAVAKATGSADAKRFAWHDGAAVAELAAPHNAAVAFHDGQLHFEADSAEAYFAAGEQDHPMSLAARPLLERAGSYAAVREQALAALRAGNEDAAGFRVSSPYRVIEVRAAS
ncbi:MAG: hypothetical protein NVSMB51_19760 [Solirubrobacteraceae bacterium]